MKAAVFHGPGRPLSIEDIAYPEPGEHEVVLKVGRCGICGSDVSMTSGQGPSHPIGAALGHEYAGEVVALGRGIERLRVGDRISVMPMAGCGRCAPCLAGRPFNCVQGYRPMMGGFGEYTLADERLSVRLPATLSLADGALIEPLASALRGVGMASIRHGDRVLVLGAGAIGAGAIYWARRLGAGRIVATARSARRAPLALDMGATAFLDSAALDAGLLEALGGAPDIVLECTGAPGMLAKAVELVRTGGTIVCAGICPVADTFFPALAVAKELSLRFSCAYDYGDFRYAVDSLDRGAIEPRAMIDHNIGLDAVPEVLESMRAGHSYGTKTLVDPNRLAL